MPYKSYLIFDFGASNGRAVCGNFDGKRINMDVVHRFDNSPVFVGDTLYWDILRLYHELKTGIINSLKSTKTITSIGIDTWGADFGLLDKDGKLISNPVNYRDENKVKTSGELFQKIPAQELYFLTGASIVPIFDLFHLYMLKVKNAVELKSADKYLSIADLFNYFLTGNKFNEFTRFTTSVFYNQKENKKEDKIFEKLGLPFNIFPEIIMPGEKVGNLSNYLCRELETLPIPVIAPSTHDTASAVAGIPEIGNKNNWAFGSIGTWIAIGRETIKPVINETTFKYAFSNEAGVENSNIFVKNISGLWSIQQCMNKWRSEKGENFSWKDIDNIYPSAQPFKTLIDIDDPIFAKPQTDMPEIIRNYSRDKGLSIPEGIDEIARCIYESIVLSIKYYFSLLESFTETKIEKLHLVGGGIKNKLLCQWIANSLKIQVVAGPIETTAMGNALMQLKADNEIKNILEGRQISADSSEIDYFEPKDENIWEDAYQKYISLFRAAK
jgi:rhamnulokinase